MVRALKEVLSIQGGYVKKAYNFFSIAVTIIELCSICGGLHSISIRN